MQSQNDPRAACTPEETQLGAAAEERQGSALQIWEAG
jgi:hypothetical protein